MDAEMERKVIQFCVNILSKSLKAPPKALEGATQERDPEASVAPAFWSICRRLSVRMETDAGLRITSAQSRVR